MSQLDDHISNLYHTLYDSYGELHPTNTFDGIQSSRHYISGYFRYFGKIRMIEAMEQTQGRQIEFICLHPEKNEETWTSDDVTYRYVGDIIPEHRFSDEMCRYYELANAYTTKYDGPDENPILFRDIIGISKTIELLEQALEQDKIIDLVWDSSTDYTAENIRFEFINVGDDYTAC